MRTIRFALRLLSLSVDICDGSGECSVYAWSRRPEDKEIGGKLRTLSSPPGYLDRRSPMEDDAARMGITPSAKARIAMHAPGRCFQWRLQGIELQTAEKPWFAAAGGCPATRELFVAGKFAVAPRTSIPAYPC